MINDEPYRVRYKDLVYLYLAPTPHSLIQNIDDTIKEATSNLYGLSDLTGIVEAKASRIFNRRYANYYLNEDFIMKLKRTYLASHVYKTESDFYRALYKLDGEDYYGIHNEFQDYPSIISVQEYIIEDVVYENIANWVSKYKAYTTNYSPLENYDLTEDEKVNTNISRTNQLDQNTFNSGADTTPVGTQTETTTGSDELNKRNLVKHGNVGVTSSQELMMQELQLRKYKLLDDILKDCARAFFISYLG